jgi:hypothetical protein
MTQEQGAPRAARSALLRIATVVVGAVCVAVIVLLVVAAVEPNWSPPPLAMFWDPRSWQAVTLTVALAALLALLLWLQRSRRHSTRPLVAILVMGVSAVVLGFAAYRDCAVDAVPFWSPLTWAFALFVGAGPEALFGLTAECPHQPLALTVARLLAIATVGLGFAAAVAVVFRSQLDVLRMRRARSRIVIDGALDVSLHAAASIRRRAARTTLVVVRADANDPQPPLHRQPGVVVLRWSDSADDALRAFALRGRSVALDAVYLLGPDTGTNLTRFERLVERLAAVPRRSKRDVRAFLRIDDVWVAEYWRRRQVERRGWAADAIGVHEATAQRLVARWMADGHDRVAVHGDGDLVLAIAAEAAQLAREYAARRADDGTRPPRIVVVGSDAAELVRLHVLHQRAFGNAARDVEAFECDDPMEGFSAALGGARSPAIMTAPVPGSSDVRPTEVAAAHPDWPVFARVSQGGAIPTEPVMERLYPFALSFADFAGIDRWERVARIAHANFLELYGVDRSRPARAPWDDGLDPFYKDSNVRLIRETLDSASKVGRSWGPITAGVDPTDTLPTAAQLEVMAQREHESWRAHHVEAGWRYAAQRDDRRRRHDLLVSWDDLDAANREKTRRSVLDALELLRALGYASRPQAAAVLYRRTGEVSAEPLTEDWQWTTSAGSTMQALAGDWRVWDGQRTWSVRPAEFGETYEQIADGRWRRRGVVRAVRAEAEQSVQSLEGTAAARIGDWIVEGSGGERWVVPDDHFRQAYEPTS